MGSQISPFQLCAPESCFSEQLPKQLCKTTKADLVIVVACFTDITEQKSAAETERRRTEEAIEAKRQQESFIDVTSHEIRNPLSVALQCSEEISCIANTSLRGVSANATEVSLPLSELKDILNAAECIEQCTMHQRRIVDDILTMSKLEGGMLPFNLSPVQPMLVVKDVLKIFSRESVHSGIEITLRRDLSLEMVNELEFLELDPGRYVILSFPCRLCWMLSFPSYNSNIYCKQLN